MYAEAANAIDHQFYLDAKWYIDEAITVFEEKVGDFYTVLATSKEFVQLDDGRWDLKTKHKSNVMKIDDSEEEDEEEILIDDFENAPVEDNYDDEDEPYTEDELDDDLKDLVIIDEDELDLNN